MSQEKLVVVTGATGQQGSSVVDWLLKEPAGRFKIRGVTRRKDSEASRKLASKGVEVVQADLSNLKETAVAFQGAWGVFGLTQFYENGYEGEQLHGKNIVEAAKANDGREGECKAISWRSKAIIEDRVIASGIPYTFVYIPMYYENFWTSFFAPSYDQDKGFNWSVGFLPDVPIFAFSVEDLGAWVVPAFRDPEAFAGQKIKIVVEYLTLRDLATQFSEAHGERAVLALELTPEQFEASRHADHPAAELMYLSWEFVRACRPREWCSSKSSSAGLNEDAKNLSNRTKTRPFAFTPGAKSYKDWLKTPKDSSP
ncbi:NmrA family protein [Coprinopsis sp. MPI-PUGE-AT-0042]|nr:NmrA family protein [Coprinopsis sp. MPI-PUGE-AT-0042]